MKKPILTVLLIILFAIAISGCSDSNKSNEPDTDSTQEDASSEVSDEYDIIFSGSVRNDKTGKWKLSRTSTSKDVTEYAVYYYNTYFKSNDEIHAIVNFATNTTNKISLLSDDVLDVCIYEYVDGEEHDASELFGGTLLNEYHITISDGSIEEIE